MSEIDEFEALGRVTVDGRRRVPLGQAAAAPKARYTVLVRAGGEILLRPVRGGATAGEAEPSGRFDARPAGRPVSGAGGPAA